MAVFFAYENWRAHGHRLTIHVADCRFCNGGRGLAGGTRADNGRWHRLGTLSSAVAARSAANKIALGGRMRLCRFCCDDD